MNVTRNKIMIGFLLYILSFSVCFPISAVSNPVTVISDVEIIDSFHSGSTFTFMMNYNFSSTIRMDATESFSFFAVLINKTDYQIKAALCFFYDITNQYQAFWMVGNPFRDIQDWYANDYFSANECYLELDFFAYTEVANSIIFPLALAKLLDNYNTTYAVEHLPELYEIYTGEFNILIETYQTTQTTISSSTSLTSTSNESDTTTSPELTSGLSFFSICSIIIILGHRSFREKN
ncbi:MAG: hypothetical protein EAX86_12395 [Candidatus Heimdallarchaeota archaeon]|nr:hypothetical protein [Candidatus Heimdallarchaeota archaeon]